jgi:hypothetical protein
MNYLKSYFELCFLGFECEVHKTLTFLYTFSTLRVYSTLLELFVQEWFHPTSNH